MTILDIITIDNDSEGVLTKRANDVTKEEISEVQVLIDDMLETCHHLNAVGLAAPQVGVSKRIFVLENGLVCINPKFIGGSGKVTSRSEGCLSIPGKRFNVKRVRNIMVRCLDRHGEPQLLKPKKKLYSIAVQHETDHLNGKLLTDK